MAFNKEPETQRQKHSVSSQDFSISWSLEKTLNMQKNYISHGKGRGHTTRQNPMKPPEMPEVQCFTNRVAVLWTLLVD